MEKEITFTLENPKQEANIFSKLLFGWCITIWLKASRKGLELVDLYKTLPEDQSQRLADALEQNWNKQLITKGKPSLLKAIRETFLFPFVLYGLLLGVQHVLVASFLPIACYYFISNFSNGENGSDDEKWIWGTSLILATIVSFLSNHHSETGLWITGMRVRIAVSSLIYRKMLKLNMKSLGTSESGQIITLLSSDVNRFDYFSFSAHHFWIVPLQIIFLTYFSWTKVGICVFAGLFPMILLAVFVISYLGSMAGKLRTKTAKATDQRVKLINEVVSGIEVIKMYAWENPFEKIIEELRNKEVISFTKSLFVQGLCISCAGYLARLSVICSMLYQLVFDNPITADGLFALVQVFNCLQIGISINLKSAVSATSEVMVSIKRLETFLLLEQKEDIPLQQTDKGYIMIKEVTASWTTILTLEDINLTIPQGALCAIVGPVGSGKSSLLQLMLGELNFKSGVTKIGGTISYASQEPWLFSNTIKNNIIFNHPYKKSVYNEVIRVCALEKDLQQFPQRDYLMVGERGISLSGGQKARINLARAVYRNADIYLLDDPLSAVDSHVGKELFNECIIKYLHGKTRVLITHQLQYLKNADIIVVLNNGRIEAMGDYDELLETNSNFTKYFVTSDETKEFDKKQIIAPRRCSHTSVQSAFSEKSEFFDYEKNEELVDSTNSKPMRDYVKYAESSCILFGVIFVAILGQICASAVDYWFSFFINEESLRRLGTIEFNSINSTKSSTFFEYFTDEFNIDGIIYNLVKTNIAVYIGGGILLCTITFNILRPLFFFLMTKKASQNIHSHMFHTLLKAPKHFFDINPSGRILNRFSKDIGTVDDIVTSRPFENVAV